MSQITNELQNKINSFIDEQKSTQKRPLSRVDAQEAILQLGNAKVSFVDITKFLKSELDIEVSPQAVAQKYKSLLRN